ncbi:hypothetical protein OGM63_13445 [Plectonema radiosum NIES-515]|uniref:Homeodomain phBC6A51-type domain-containing protein n=1 Tax=Plectonema radiosum NIES-515 TaxID=2986073 RepID=A0ABT3AZG1_9CYAN|nr:hypothetical protein [Plectonema radiosum]MCV3214504.1 hypothetical protein [Plectonema radiosum NIES-515]
MTPLQYSALTQILAGYSTATVAKNTGLTIKSIERWRQLPRFKALMREAMSAMFTAAVAEIVLHSQQAAKELCMIALDSEVPSRVRVSAITAMLNVAGKAHDAHLQSRLEKLEEEINYYGNLKEADTTTRKYFPENDEYDI